MQLHIIDPLFHTQPQSNLAMNFLFITPGLPAQYDADTSKVYQGGVGEVNMAAPARTPATVNRRRAPL